MPLLQTLYRHGFLFNKYKLVERYTERMLIDGLIYGRRYFILSFLWQRTNSLLFSLQSGVRTH